MKDDDREEGYGDAWNDQVDRVEERLPPYRDVERDVRVGFRAAGVGLAVLLRRHAQDVPLDALVELLQIDPVRDLVSTAQALLQAVLQVHLKSKW